VSSKNEGDYMAEIIERELEASITTTSSTVLGPATTQPCRTIDQDDDYSECAKLKYIYQDQNQRGAGEYFVSA
jgi:hypothetical protein